MSTETTPTQNGTDERTNDGDDEEATTERNPFAEEIAEVAPYANRGSEVRR